MRKIWLLLTVVCFGLLDMVSTMIVYGQIGTFEYESGLLPGLMYAAGGIPAVIAIKMVLTVLIAFTLYYMAMYLPDLDIMCTVMCAGASIVGVLVSASNLEGAFTGSTLWVLGYSIDQIAYIIFALAFAAGLACVAINYLQAGSETVKAVVKAAVNAGIVVEE